jgi:hypothetical protein
MCLRRSLAICSALLVGCLSAAAAGAAPLDGLPPATGAAETFQSDDKTGFALGGFDPVTYFLPAGPLPGKPAYEWTWAGVAWRFSTAANRAAFIADPWSFAPQIGGYDAEAASRERLVRSDPLLFAIRNGQLFVFRDKTQRTRFLADEAVAARSQEGWRILQRSLVRS